MPKSIDHRKARAELAKLAPEALKAITVRLPAGLLMGVHQYAEQQGLDLASAIRELTERGREAAARPGGQVSAADLKAVKTWGKRVERELRAGRSPFDAFLAQDDADPALKALPAILAGLDYQGIFQELKEKSDEGLPRIERVWKRMKADAPSDLRQLMEALDKLEKGFLARKKLYGTEGPEGDVPIIHWLLSDAVMQRLGESSTDDDNVEAVRQLITARYLVAEVSSKPWEFAWDE